MQQAREARVKAVHDYAVSPSAGHLYLSPFEAAGGRVMIPLGQFGAVKNLHTYAYDTLTQISGVYHAGVQSFFPTLALNTSRIRYLKDHVAFDYMVSTSEDHATYLPVGATGVMDLDVLYAAPSFDELHLAMIDRLKDAGYTQCAFEVVRREPNYGVHIQIQGVQE